MAKENVKKFYEEVTKNRDLQEKLTQAQENYSGDKEDRDTLVKELLIPFAKECGYEFTAEEVLAVDKERAIEAGAVSEEELENVSGGWSVCVVGGGATRKAICFLIGFGENDKNNLADTSVGAGVFMCLYSGIGIGLTVDTKM